MGDYRRTAFCEIVRCVGGEEVAQPSGGTAGRGSRDFPNDLYPNDDDGWGKLVNHAWERHGPHAVRDGQAGTKFPAGITRDFVAEMLRDILNRVRLTAEPGSLDPELIARLDSGEATLEERRERFVNLYARVGYVRYQIRLAGMKSTVHPMDGDGVVRHSKRGGEITETSMPLGARPVQGWDVPRRQA